MSTGQPKTCIVAGHICLDVIPELTTQGDFASTFQPGRLLEAGPVVMSTGGAVSNTGQALHTLGIETTLMGKIGDDMFGQKIDDLLRQLEPRLAQGMRFVPNEASSYTIILSPPNTDRIFFHCPGTNDTFEESDVDYEAVKQADLFHFGYPQIMKQMYQADGAALLEMFKQAKATGVTTSLDTTMPDPNSPAGQADWPSIFAQVLPFVDIFTPSIEEILFMLQPDLFKALSSQVAETGGDILAHLTPNHLADVAEQLLDFGAKVVLLKASYLGLYLRTATAERLADMGRAQPANWTDWANRELWAPIFQTEVVGTTGAGDSAIAGMLAALLRSLPPVQAMTVANAVGACNVEAPDAVSGVRPWEETLARIESGWPRQPLTLSDARWQFDETQQVWLGPHEQS